MERRRTDCDSRTEERRVVGEGREGVEKVWSSDQPAHDSLCEEAVSTTFYESKETNSRS